MQKEVFLASVLTIIGCAWAWPDLYDNEFKRWSMSRRSYDECQGSGGKCYSSTDCCSSYVCAAFDEFDLSPTVPGWCVHKKELDHCVNNYDCPDNKRCVPLSGHNYCVPLPEEIFEGNGIETGSFVKAKGGIGKDCASSTDCAMYAADGTTKLCCQKIRRGRQGLATKCDKIRSVSECI